VLVSAIRNRADRGSTGCRGCSSRLRARWHRRHLPVRRRSSSCASGWRGLAKPPCRAARVA
jgi:hypothetical protein